MDGKWVDEARLERGARHRHKTPVRHDFGVDSPAVLTASDSRTDPSRPVRWGMWGLGLLTFLFAFARLVRLDADPSGMLSTAFLTDEGWYSQAARNHAVFGQWSLDEHNVALVLCPLHTFLLRLSYALFGVSFWSTRIVGAFASVMTVGLVAWCLRARPKVATLAAAIVATQPVLFGLSRVAFCENSQLFFVTLTWVAASDQRRRRSSWVLAGAAAALAVVVKGSALYAIALAMVAPFLSTTREGWRRNLREAAWVAVGGGAGGRALHCVRVAVSSPAHPRIQPRGFPSGIPSSLHLGAPVRNRFEPPRIAA